MNLLHHKKEPKDKDAVRVAHLHEAIKTGNVEEVQALVKKGGKKLLDIGDEAFQKTALHVAAAEGSLPFATFFVEKGAFVNPADRSKWTPLHDACRKGHIGICNLLLNHDANVNAANLDGALPLHYLVKHKPKGNEKEAYIELLKAMAAKGLRVDQQNCLGETSLHQAAIAGNLVATKFLLGSTLANVNAVTHHKETALHYCARKGRTDIAEFLLKKGCNPALKGDYGTALDVALAQQQREMVELLDERAAKPSQIAKDVVLIERTMFAHEIAPDMVESIRAELSACMSTDTPKNSLQLTGYQLIQVPPIILDFRALVVLDLANNRLRQLPSLIKQLVCLQRLDLRNNALMSLPAEIGLLRTLQYLNLSQNQLTSLPNSLVLLRDLTFLDVSYNFLMRPWPPAIFGFLPLQQLNAIGNPLPKALEQQTRDRFVEFVKNLFNAPRPRFLQPIKLMLLGPQSGVLAARISTKQMRDLCKRAAESSNKKASRDRRLSVETREASGIGPAGPLSPHSNPTTNLARRETFKRATVDFGSLLSAGGSNTSTTSHVSASIPEQNSSAALKITPATIGFEEANMQPQPPLTEINFNIWELSEAAAGLYPLFLSNHSFYVVTFIVEDPSMTALDLTLQNLKISAAESELVLVALYSDPSYAASATQQAVASALSRRYETHFPAVRRVCFIAQESGEGVADLLTSLGEQLQTAEWARRTVAPPLAHLELHLAGLRELDASTVLDWRAFERACTDCGVAAEDISAAATHLRDTGAALSYSGPAEKRLILDPAGLAAQLSRPINGERARRGMLPREVLVEMWSAGDGPRIPSDLLIAVMQSARLWYDLDQLGGIRSWPNTPPGTGEASPRLSLTGSFLHLPKARSSNSGLRQSLTNSGERRSSKGSGQSNYKRIFVPELLPLNPTDALSILWPTATPAGTREYNRVYLFAISPLHFFYNVTLSLLRFGWKAKLFWRDGCLLELGQPDPTPSSAHGSLASSNSSNLDSSSASSNCDRDRLLVRTRPWQNEKRCVDISIRGPTASERLGFVTNLFETYLIDNAMADLVEVFIPCAHCGPVDPHWFSVTDFENALLNGQTTLTCPGREPTLTSSKSGEKSGVSSKDALPPLAAAPDSATATTGKRLSMNLSTRALLQKARILPREQEIASTPPPAVPEVRVENPLLQRRRPDAKRLSMGVTASVIATANGAVLEPHPVPSEPVALTRLAPDLAMETIARVSFEAISNTVQIGHGATATVFSGSFQGAPVAVKLMHISNDGSQKSSIASLFAEFRRESKLMNQLQHPNFIRLLGVSLKPLCIIMELMAGNLYDYMHDKSRPLNWRLRVSLAEDIALGMRFLHEQNPPLVHRDLKSPNVMLTTADGRIVAKVADVGITRALAFSDMHGAVVENPIWLAPEVMLRKGYTEKVDVYSYGVILWELLTRQGFFEEIPYMYAIQKKVMKGKRPEIPSCPEQWESLIKRCWAQSPDARPSFAEVVQLLPPVKSQFSSQELLQLDMRLPASARAPVIQSKEEFVIRLVQDRHMPLIKPDGLAVLLAIHCLPVPSGANQQAVRILSRKDICAQTGLDMAELTAALQRLKRHGYISGIDPEADADEDRQRCNLQPLPRNPAGAGGGGSIIVNQAQVAPQASINIPKAASDTYLKNQSSEQESAPNALQASASSPLSGILTKPATDATAGDLKAERRKSIQLNLAQLQAAAKNM